ncbi:hypothetical protein FGSG_04532 [Fusarium graminearum PH-1]|uniref:hypothetical protein n=1 Tax=Gibberella zeae (strain ATCC MYA-4620 / CBS 123657 / FGSC 9075 / NRRL 31084 / PH-1) TaxID=229533 RepID=UPI000023E44A|nr:hypothetical protein FGSG_04532 [Fusarium graminearum PH-1]ESU08556.1 hypothetical protein FGSG_04532 [Fusarium graminearum PH-1]|eukprot:XP_011321055.1 hypothetical protein FGSG_04532 [Fusarium graminearum PH-1]
MDEEIEALIEAMRKQKQDYFLPPEWDGKVVFLKNTKSGTRLDLFAGGRANGTPINGWQSNGSTAKQWKLEKRGNSIWNSWAFQNVASGLYLTLWDDSPQNGTKVVGWERAIAKETSGLFTIQSSIGRCNFPDLHLGLQENGTRVQGWQREELMGNQVWMIEDATVDISSEVADGICFMNGHWTGKATF